MEQVYHMTGLTFFGRCGRMGKMALLCAAFLIGSSGLALGQEKTSKEEKTKDYILEDTVVTATKTGETKLQDTPLSITAFSDEVLDSHNAFRLTDLDQFVPNAQFDIWGPGLMVGYIRGIGSGQLFQFGEQAVGFYLDGVYLERGIGANLNFMDVERIEVLRGPQGTLYGRNATAGAVNVITKKPSDKFQAKLSAEIGNFGKRRVDATISGPIVKDKVKARLSFSDSSHDGFLENANGPDIYDENYTGVRGSVEFTPTDKVDIVLSGDWFNSDSRDFNNRLMTKTGLFASRASAAGIPSSTIVSDDFWKISQEWDSRDILEVQGLSARVTIELPHKMCLRSITGYREAEQHISMDMDGTALKLFVSENVWEYRTLSQELQLDGTWDRLKWLLGVYYLHAANNFPTTPNHFDFIMPGLKRYYDSDATTEAWAGFGNLTYAVTDRLSLEAGLRYSYEEKDSDYYKTWSNVPAIFPSQDLKFNESWDDLSPRFGLNYRFTDEALCYGTISKGFKSGTFGADNPAGQTTVGPEEVWAYEIGFKTDWFKNRLRVNGALFYYDYTGLQDRVLLPTGSQLRNAAEATIQGAEIEFSVRPVSGLTFNGSFSLLDAKYDKFPNAVSPAGPAVDASGNRLAYSPEWKLDFGAQYVINVGDYGFLTLRGDLSRTNDQFFSAVNDPRMGQEAYTLVNALARFDTIGGHWGFEIFGRNLGEEEYLRSVMAIAGDVIGFVGEPRTFGFRAIYNF